MAEVDGELGDFWELVGPVMIPTRQGHRMTARCLSDVPNLDVVVTAGAAAS